MTNTALTIAGSDSGGGAGIQADLKTMNSLKIWGMSVITCITAQNLTGVSAIQSVETSVVASQLDAVFEGFPVGAVKTGMLYSADIIKVVADRLKDAGITNLVVDPVMVATSGARLLQEDAIDALKNHLLPLAGLITPNIPEAEILADTKIGSQDNMLKAAAIIHKATGAAVLIKGGHFEGSSSDDYFYSAKDQFELPSKRYDAKYTHGTGCTFSAAAASFLAMGNMMPRAVRMAKKYITNAVKDYVIFDSNSGGLNFFDH